jgi:hypothetical protein
MAVAGMGWWTWSWQPDELLEHPGQVAAPQAAQGPQAMASNPQAAEPGQPADLQAWQRQAQDANRAVAEGPPPAAVQGVITVRPSYVSMFEWMMLKSTAERHAQPEQELTRLVNFLRFMRMRDVLDGTPDSRPDQQRALAAALLQELPQRVQLGEISRKEALGMQAEWLAIIQPDEALRAELLQREAARLGPAAP